MCVMLFAFVQKPVMEENTAVNNDAPPTTTTPTQTSFNNTNNNLSSKTTSNALPNSAPTTSNDSSVQKRITALNKASTSNINNNNNNKHAAMPTRPASVASAYRSGTSSRLGISSGIPAKRAVKKAPVPPPKTTSSTGGGLKTPIPMPVTSSSSAARRVAANRISSSQMHSTVAKKPGTTTSTSRASVTSTNNITNKRTTASKPAPTLAIRTSAVKTATTKKESAIPQASRRTITATSTTRKVRDKAGASSIKQKENHKAKAVVDNKDENQKINKNNKNNDDNDDGDDDEEEVIKDKHECKCEDSEICECIKFEQGEEEEIEIEEDHEEQGGHESDTSSNASSGKTKSGSTTLKKTKSTRTPQRHATYVSELNKDIRRKFQKQKAERESKTDAVVKKSGAGAAQRPKVAPKPTAKTSTATKKRMDERHSKAANSPGRIVHCPLHSKFGNQLSSRFIKARCIPECPHFNHDTSSTTRHRSDSLSSSTSSTVSSPGLRKRPVTGGSGTVAAARTRPPTKAATKTVPYIITTSNKKTVTARRTGPGSGVANVRVRSAPATSTKVFSSSTSTKKPVQSYLVRNGMIPDPGKSHIPSAKPKKVRQKSFKLNRTKSKSFKYKNKPSVVAKKATTTDKSTFHNESMYKATVTTTTAKRAKQVAAINSKTIPNDASLTTSELSSAMESDDNYSTTDFETETENMHSSTSDDGGHMSSEDATVLYRKQRTAPPPKTKKPLRQKSLRLVGRSKSRSKSFRAKSKSSAKAGTAAATSSATTGKTKTRRRLSSKKSDSLLSEDSLQFDDDSLGAAGGLDTPPPLSSMNELNLNFDDLEFGEDSFGDDEDYDGEGDLEFETDEQLVAYYFELFKKEFPEIVQQASLTKEEMVSFVSLCLPCSDLSFFG